MPAVSVIIPTYQSAVTLPHAINSVLQQTFTDFEIIVVDDGSTDETKDLVTSINDPRIQYLHQPNQGPAAARNTGAAHSRGEFLAFLDADDEWLPQKLAGQVRFMREYSQGGLIFTDSLNINQAEASRTAYSSQYHDVIEPLISEALQPVTDFYLIPSNARTAIYRRNFLNTSTVLVRAWVFNQLEGFNTIFCFGTEDYDLWLRLSKCTQFVYWHEVCANRYKSQSSLSSRSERWLVEQIRFHKMYLNSQDDTDLHPLALQELRRAYRSLVKYYGRICRPAQALTAYKESTRYGFSPETALYALGALGGPLPFIVGGNLSRVWSKFQSRRR